MNTFYRKDYDTDNIISYVNFYSEADNKTLRLNEVHTDEAYRRKGYFKDIPSEIKAYALKNNYTKITLTAAPIADISNDDLVKIYKECGFQSEQDNKYRMYMNLV